MDNNSIINKSSSLHIRKCEGCTIGIKKNDHCIILLEKKFSVLIRSKIRDQLGENNQKLKVIDQMIEDIILDVKTTIKDEKIPMNTVTVSIEQDERIRLITNIFGYSVDNTESNLSTNALAEIYKNNKNQKRSQYTFYTDSSMKKYKEHIEMGIG